MTVRSGALIFTVICTGVPFTAILRSCWFLFFAMRVNSFQNTHGFAFDLFGTKHSYVRPNGTCIPSEVNDHVPMIVVGWNKAYRRLARPAAVVVIRATTLVRAERRMIEEHHVGLCI